jgi:hypothetical protein
MWSLALHEQNLVISRKNNSDANFGFFTHTSLLTCKSQDFSTVYNLSQKCHPPEGTPLRDGVSEAKDLLTEK